MRLTKRPPGGFATKRSCCRAMPRGRTGNCRRAIWRAIAAVHVGRRGSGRTGCRRRSITHVVQRTGRRLAQFFAVGAVRLTAIRARQPVAIGAVPVPVTPRADYSCGCIGGPRAKPPPMLVAWTISNRWGGWPIKSADGSTTSARRRFARCLCDAATRCQGSTARSAAARARAAPTRCQFRRCRHHHPALVERKPLRPPGPV